MSNNPSPKQIFRINYVLKSKPSDEARGLKIGIMKELARDGHFDYQAVGPTDNPDVTIILGLDEDQVPWLRAVIEGVEFGGHIVFYYAEFVNPTWFKTDELPEEHQAHRIVRSFPNAKWIRHFLPSFWKYLADQDQELPE